MVKNRKTFTGYLLYNIPTYIPTYLVLNTLPHVSLAISAKLSEIADSTHLLFTPQPQNFTLYTLDFHISIVVFS